MKKLLSIMLVLLMALSVFACTNTPKEPDKPVEQPTTAPTDAPVVPDTPAVTYEGLGLQLKNKTGLTIDAMYIYPAGGEMGNSVVEKGWQDKEVDPEGYEKFIYIVREAGIAMKVTVVFEDGTTVDWEKDQEGKELVLGMYHELSLKKGTDVANWEHEVLDKDEDKAACDLVAAVGKTADSVYPGYVVLPLELKNKTGKNIVEYYFYMKKGEKDFGNAISYAADLEGNPIESWANGRPYLFTYLVRPATEDDYWVLAVFDDGTSLEYRVEDWLKPDPDGNFKNEVSLKSAEDNKDTVQAYDADVEKGADLPVPELIELAMARRLPADGWLPSYTDVTVDEATLEAAKQALATNPLVEVKAEEPADQPAAPTGEVPSGYTGLHLMLKNKTGKEIAKVYLFPTGEDKGKNIFKTVLADGETIPTEDENVEGAPHEVFAYVFRLTDTLGAMTLRIKFADDTEQDIVLEEPVVDYTVFSIKPDKFSQKVADDAEDIANMDAVAAAGVSTDGVTFEPIVTMAAVPEGYTALHLMLKNKTGKEIAKVYLFPTGEDKGKNIFKTVLADGETIPTEDENVEGAPHEVFAYVFRLTDTLGAMTLRIKFADDTEQDIVLEEPVVDYTVFSIKPDKFSQKVADDAEDIANMDALALKVLGVSTDGVEY